MVLSTQWALNIISNRTCHQILAFGSFEILAFWNFSWKKKSMRQATLLCSCPLTLLLRKGLFHLLINPEIIPKYHMEVPASTRSGHPSPGRRLCFHPQKNFTCSPDGHWPLSGSNITLKTAPKKGLKAFRVVAAVLAHVAFSAGKEAYPSSWIGGVVYLGPEEKSLCAAGHLWKQVNQWALSFVPASSCPGFP